MGHLWNFPWEMDGIEWDWEEFLGHVWDNYIDITWDMNGIWHKHPCYI